MFSISGSMLEIYFYVTLRQKQVTNVGLVFKESDTESENLSRWSGFLYQIAKKKHSPKDVSFIGI